MINSDLNCLFTRKAVMFKAPNTELYRHTLPNWYCLTPTVLWPLRMTSSREKAAMKAQFEPLLPFCWTFFGNVAILVPRKWQHIIIKRVNHFIPSHHRWGFQVLWLALFPLLNGVWWCSEEHIPRWWDMGRYDHDEAQQPNILRTGSWGSDQWNLETVYPQNVFIKRLRAIYSQFYSNKKNPCKNNKNAALNPMINDLSVPCFDSVGHDRHIKLTSFLVWWA